MAGKEGESNRVETHSAPRVSVAPGSPASWRWRTKLDPQIAPRWTAGRVLSGASWGHTPRGLFQLQHHLNALHLMAVLARWGIPRRWARALARCWERMSHGWLYGSGLK